MRKAIIIGCPGSGKSTFARKLRDRTGLPLVYLDRIWHRPDKTTVTKDEFDLKLLEELKKVTVRASHRCTRITEEGVYAISPEGSEVLFPADNVIMAVGMRSRSAEVEALRGLVTDFVVLGDGLRARNILAAVRNAYDAAMDL